MLLPWHHITGKKIHGIILLIEVENQVAAQASAFPLYSQESKHLPLQPPWCNIHARSAIFPSPPMKLHLQAQHIRCASDRRPAVLLLYTRATDPAGAGHKCCAAHCSGAGISFSSQVPASQASKPSPRTPAGRGRRSRPPFRAAMVGGRATRLAPLLLLLPLLAVVSCDGEATTTTAGGQPDDTAVLCVSKCGTCPAVCSPPAPSDSTAPPKPGGGYTPPSPKTGGGYGSPSPPAGAGQGGKGAGRPSNFYYLFTSAAGGRSGGGGGGGGVTVLLLASALTALVARLQ
jgi:hypothetical protein